MQAINPFAAAAQHAPKDAYFSFTPLDTNPVPINDTQINTKFISPGFAALQQKQPQMLISQSPNPMLMPKVTFPLEDFDVQRDIQGKNVKNVDIAIIDQSTVNENLISKNEFVKPPLELKLSDDEQEGDGGGSARAETPIHPNQVVDGIKFMQVQDPTYIAAELFDQCEDSDHEFNIFST